MVVSAVDSAAIVGVCRTRPCFHSLQRHLDIQQKLVKGKVGVELARGEILWAWCTRLMLTMVHFHMIVLC